jgi:predicted nucleic acid-binding protein
LLYVDSSALVKLIQAEHETTALITELQRWPNSVTSVVGEIELRRAGRRAGIPPEDVDAVLDSVGLIALDDPVRKLATETGTPVLRSLDAIHLATALSLGNDVGGFVCYDQRLAHDASAAGLAVLSP